MYIQIYTTNQSFFNNINFLHLVATLYTIVTSPATYG